MSDKTVNTITVAGHSITIVADPSLKPGEIRIGLPQDPNKIILWGFKRIMGIVWVVSTDAKLDSGKIYKTSSGSEFPTPYFEVKYDGWKPDSLYRYIVVEVHSHFPEGK